MPVGGENHRMGVVCRTHKFKVDAFAHRGIVGGETLPKLGESADYRCIVSGWNHHEDISVRFSGIQRIAPVASCKHPGLSVGNIHSLHSLAVAADKTAYAHLRGVFPIGGGVVCGLPEVGRVISQTVPGAGEYQQSRVYQFPKPHLPISS